MTRQVKPQTGVKMCEAKAKPQIESKMCEVAMTHQRKTKPQITLKMCGRVIMTTKGCPLGGGVGRMVSRLAGWKRASTATTIVARMMQTLVNARLVGASGA